LFKSDDKDIHNVTKDLYFRLMLCIHHRNLEKFYSAVFNIMRIILLIVIHVFFKQQIRILEWLLKDHVTDAKKIIFEITGITCVQREKSCFKSYQNWIKKAGLVIRSNFFKKHNKSDFRNIWLLHLYQKQHFSMFQIPTVRILNNSITGEFQHGLLDR